MNKDFVDFTTENYEKLLNIAKEKYVFTTYGKYIEDKFILWRHDCDLSLERSLHLAKIEKKLGIRSTFFLNIHSEFYNILEKSQIKIVKEIIELGHEIGLHFDANFYSIQCEEDICRFLQAEVNILEFYLNKKITVFSFHNPSEKDLEFNKDEYAGLINCYSSWFRNVVGYCSDSNGYWRHEKLENVLRDANFSKLQVLTHPGWWQKKAMQPYDRVLRCIEGRATSVREQYIDMLESHGRVNVRNIIE